LLNNCKSGDGQVAADAERKGLQLAYSLHPELAARSFHGDALRIRQAGA